LIQPSERDGGNAWELVIVEEATSKSHKILDYVLDDPNESEDKPSATDVPRHWFRSHCQFESQARSGQEIKHPLPGAGRFEQLRDSAFGFLLAQSQARSGQQIKHPLPGAGRFDQFGDNALGFSARETAKESAVKDFFWERTIQLEQTWISTTTAPIESDSSHSCTSGLGFAADYVAFAVTESNST
jgi:hypothetical protein